MRRGRKKKASQLCYQSNAFTLILQGVIFESPCSAATLVHYTITISVSYIVIVEYYIKRKIVGERLGTE